jgi:DNA ligase (NAD+)
MERAGFSVVSGYCLVDTIEDAIQQIDRINKERDKLTFDIDGAVVKLIAFHQGTCLAQHRNFRVGHAFKYPPEEKETRIISIEVQVGRTGVLTPIAYLSRSRLREPPSRVQFCTTRTLLMKNK